MRLKRTLMKIGKIMLYYLMLLILAPVLIVQGKRARNRAIVLPEASGERAGVQGEGTPISVLILGDSAAAGVGVRQQSQALSGMLTGQLAQHFRVHWQLLAQSGLTTKGCTKMLDTSREQFDVVVVSVGVNDVVATSSLQEWLQHQQQLVDTIRHRCQPQYIMLTKVPPMGRFPLLPQPLRAFLGYKAKLFNRVLADWLSTQSDCDLVDIGHELTPEHMADDGFHPGEHIYAKWGHVVASAILAAYSRQT